MILDEVFKAVTYLFIAGIVSYAYYLAKQSNGDRIDVMWKGFLWCVGIALFASLMLGSPTCLQQDDPLYGGCIEYADNGYGPTLEQRAARFACFMTLLYVPVLFGAFAKKKDNVATEISSKS